MTETGPVFGEFLVNLSLILKTFTETGGIQIFFSILNQALGVVLAIFSNEIIQKIFLFLAAVKGITIAFGLLLTVSKFAFKVLIGNILALGPASIFSSAGVGALTKSINTKIGAMQRATATAVPYRASLRALSISLRQLALSYWAVLAPLLPFIIAGAAIAAVFYLMYKNSEDLRKAVSELGRALKEQLLKSWELIKGALQKLMPDIENVSDIFKKMGDWVAKYVMPPLTIWYTFLIKLATFFVVYFIGALTIFINYIKGFVGLWIGLFQAIRTGSFDPLKKAFENFVNGIIDGVNTIIDALNVLNPFKDIPYIDYIGDAKNATDDLKDSTKPLTDAQEAARRKMEETAASAANLHKEFGSIKDIQATVRGALETTFDSVTAGARSLINARDAARAFKEETDKLTTTMKDGSLSLDQKTDAVYGYAASVLDAIKKDIELGGTQESTQKILEDGKQAFIAAAGEVGIFGDEAEKLANKLALTPDTIEKTFKATGLGDLQTMITQLQNYQTLAGNATQREGSSARNAAVSTELIKIQAKVEQAMTVKFGKGNTSGDALWVRAADGSFAKGGRVGKGDTILVGEKGPEFFVPGSDGTIIPNNKLSSVASGGGSSPVVNVYPSQGMDEVELAHNVSRQLAWTMRRGV
jgi:hypothetical protein